jgi:sugar phosphate isomerase/epimerase
MYHTHSGPREVGASIWDLFLLLRDQNTAAVAANYDIGHATVEGGYGGWIHSANLMLPYMRGVALKDFLWQRNARGEWEPGWCALGKGMVNFKAFLPMLKSAGFAGPLQLHFEYPELGAAHTGGKLDIPKDRFIAIMKRDVALAKGMLRDAGWA